MNAQQRDVLLAKLELLDRPEACLKGTPMIPIHRETLKDIIAALRRCKAIEDGD